jgi:hypothetical protein
MTKRLSVTPRQGLLRVPPQLRRKFIETACEILIEEGRMAEVLLKISGLTLEDLTDQPKPSTSRSYGRKQVNKCRSASAFEARETFSEDLGEKVTDGPLHKNRIELSEVNTTGFSTDLEVDSDQSTLF